MGPSGYLRPPLCTFPSLKAFVIILTVLFITTVFQSADGFNLRGGEECLVGQCTSQFQNAKQNLNISESGTPDGQAICTALRTYRHCISKTVGCTGNIMYYSIRNIVNRQMTEFNCNKTGVIVKPSKKETWNPVPNACHFQGKKVYRHCGLFGDPHLRTFNGDFQTCRVKGAWPLVNNDYLIVQVTNDPVEGNTDATATSKLTVIVKGNQLCTSKNFQTYQAQTNNLPGAFEDGHVTYGPYRSLELVEVDPGSHVEIHIRYIDTIVVIRQIGSYFTFSIKMPEELINSSLASGDLQLCARGCPSSELINYKKYLADRKHTSSEAYGEKREEAEEVCRKAGLVGFYFDSCVFDIMATGDVNFTVSAISSQRDLLELQPSSSQTMGNRTSLQAYDKQYGKEGGQNSNGGSGGGGGGAGHAISSWRGAASSQFKVQLFLVLFLTFFANRTLLLPCR